METTRGGLTGSMLDGRYRIGSVIARGGMSTVYRGLDTRLDRPVAVKIMAARYSGDAAFLTRFSREARLAAGLSHPGIVAVYDHGRDGEHVFLVMELVDGGTLRELIHQRGALRVDVTVSILQPLLGALAAAHRAGLVHRDVKPENVLISAHGELKVADFGLVRAVTSQTMATGDVILGTVAYLSPEQVETGRSDTRSDVYSAGIVGWEMLTGEPPFTGENAMSVAYQHVHSEVPMVGDVARGVPALLEDLLADATQRNPERRPRDAAAFGARLATIRTRLGIPLVPIPVPTRAQPARPTDDPDAAVPLAGRTNGVARVGTVVAGRDPGADSQRPTAQPAGPRGTAMMRADGPATADEPRGGAQPLAEPVVRYSVPQPARQRRWLRRLIVVVVIVLLGAAAAAAGWWIGDGRWAYAPKTVGMVQQAAETAVRNAGLIPQVDSASDDVAPAGTVTLTKPGSGAKLLRGSPVDLVVSTGRPTVPQIRAGTDVQTAAELLTDAGLTVTPAAQAVVPVAAYDDSTPVGRVLRTFPAAGTAVHTGAAVTLITSLGPPPIVVPEVTGKSADDAENKLIVAGFTVGTPIERFDPNSTDGTVLGTEPEAGQQHPRGSSVHLVVDTSLVLPDVRDLTTDAAQARLAAAGFAVSIGDPQFDAGIDTGNIVGTDPVAGARLDPAHAAVTLYPSNAVTVPNVGGASLSDAKQTLDGAGLHYQLLGLFRFGSSGVISQSPKAGARIEPGGTVFLTVF
ncbi:MAG: Stk1 family PASTA domain-containing Ser/Thr kinase [Nakamurella sp.]